MEPVYQVIEQTMSYKCLGCDHTCQPSLIIHGTPTKDGSVAKLIYTNVVGEDTKSKLVWLCKWTPSGGLHSESQTDATKYNGPRYLQPSGLIDELSARLMALYNVPF